LQRATFILQNTLQVYICREFLNVMTFLSPEKRCVNFWMFFLKIINTIDSLFV